MHPVLRLVRINNVLVSLVGTFVAGLAADGRGLGLGWTVAFPLLLASLSTAAVTAGGNVLNDVSDVGSDRVNHPERPLVTGEFSVASARWLTGGLFAASVVLVAPQIPVRPALAVILAAALASVLGYEITLKASGLAGNLTVAFLTAAVFLYGAASVGPILIVVPFALMAFFATFSREVIKDMEDAPGDTDRRTLPRTSGMAVSTGVARGAVVVAIVLSPLPFLYLVPPASLAGIMYGAIVLVADALFVISVASLPGALHREQSMSKLAMAVALLAFLASAFR